MGHSLQAITVTPAPLSRHIRRINVCLGDGSVHLSASGMTAAIWAAACIRANGVPLQRLVR